jgi:hypothetical protein
LGRDRGRPAIDPTPEWAASLAADRTFLRQSLLLVGELGVLEATANAPTDVTAALGVRYQLTPTLVLDAGVSRRLAADAGPDLGLTLGLTHAFAAAGLMPSGARYGVHRDPICGPAPESGRCYRSRPARSRRAAGAGCRAGPARRAILLPGRVQLAEAIEAARLFNAFDYGHAVPASAAAPGRADEALAKEVATTRDRW